MSRFSYEIQRGISVFTTPRSKLFVVKRTPTPQQHGDFAVNVFTRSCSSAGPAVISLLYRPERLGEQKVWRDLPKISIARTVEDLKQAVSTTDEGTRHRQAGPVITQFALYAASGLLDQELHAGQIDAAVAMLPDYKQATTLHPQLHKDAMGAVDKFVARMAQPV